MINFIAKKKEFTVQLVCEFAIANNLKKKHHIAQEENILTDLVCIV